MASVGQSDVHGLTEERGCCVHEGAVVALMTIESPTKGSDPTVSVHGEASMERGGTADNGGELRVAS